MSFKLLSEPIQRYIRKKRWESLRPIQTAAIEKIISTDNNYILASKTASGKTEAAFLPILSKSDFLPRGVRVIYISPLIALINDQFKRIDELCEDLEIKVTKWHGEAKVSEKRKLEKDPSGIVLITPESLEAMLSNHLDRAKTLFSQTDYIVIDEIHAFLGNERGLQLMSIIHRLKEINNRPTTCIGLSATIGKENFIEIKKLFGTDKDTKILLDKGKKETSAKLYFYPFNLKTPNPKFLQHLYNSTKEFKTLIFPNSRAAVEMLSVNLRRLAEKDNFHTNYFAHHSSVDREIREFVENKVKSGRLPNFTLTCTSTLELGIDIGSVDKVVQVGSAHSVASLIQRIGRSGRKEGAISAVDMYGTSKLDTIQSMACWLLHLDDYLEARKINTQPLDVMFHQILSIVSGLNGVLKSELIPRIKSNPLFKEIDDQNIKNILNSCLRKNYLEKIGDEIIIGLDGERIVKSKDFYALFQPEFNFQVINEGNKIGDVGQPPNIGSNIYLAARIWRVVDIDQKRGRVYVVKANDGKPPIFFGSGGDVAHIVEEKMFQILLTPWENFKDLEFLDTTVKEAHEELYADFLPFGISDYVKQRPVIAKPDKIEIIHFMGGAILRTLCMLLDVAGHSNEISADGSSLYIQCTLQDFDSFKSNITMYLEDLDNYIIESLKEPESKLISFSKYGSYLPLEEQLIIFKENCLVIEDTINFIRDLDLVQSKYI